MKPVVVARIKCKPSFLSVLEKDGYVVEADPHNPNLATVELQLLKQGSADEPDQYKIPPFASSEFVLMRVSECRLKDTGAAQIVSRLSGSALYPYQIEPGIDEH